MATKRFVGEQFVRAKGTMDGSKTLAEAAKKLRFFADWLEARAQEGWQVDGVIADDFGYLVRTTPAKRAKGRKGTKK